MDEYYNEESVGTDKLEDESLFDREVVKEDHDLFLVDNLLKETFRR